MAAALASEKRADQGDEEHQVAGQAEKQYHAVAAEEVAWPAPAGWPVLPVFTVSPAACRPAGNRRLTAKSGILALCLNRGAGERSRHGLTPTFEDYSCLASGSHCNVEI